jgi:hypothetical protein
MTKGPNLGLNIWGIYKWIVRWNSTISGQTNDCTIMVGPVLRRRTIATITNCHEQRPIQRLNNAAAKMTARLPNRCAYK